MAAKANHKFQAPKGTRDFYPADMAVRRYIESVWREVSINHGFEEIDGPTFEHLELYTAKSGPGIVSELFSFRREGGDTDYALRPEFTPTLARMVAARAAQLPKLIKWFSVASMFRAERPQRGRLREHIQWNVDILGVPEDGIQMRRADAEVIAVAASFLEKIGLKPHDVRIKFGQRKSIEADFRTYKIPKALHEPTMTLLDDRLKIGVDEYRQRAKELNLPEEFVRKHDPAERVIVRLDADPDDLPLDQAQRDEIRLKRQTPGELFYELEQIGLSQWCEFDSMIIRGLAYYTDLVFEVHEAGGRERAIAGGGRYDNLVELFGGPHRPAAGFAMGDVVLRLMLEDRGLLKAEELMPRPDVFVIDTTEGEPGRFSKLIADLRRAGLHARHSYRATRNVGKLLGEAGKARARFAVILGRELEAGNVVLKDLDAGEQREVPLNTLADELLRLRAAHP
jgi:histidyl-tRNA synthetase